MRMERQAPRPLQRNNRVSYQGTLEGCRKLLTLDRPFRGRTRTFGICRSNTGLTTPVAPPVAERAFPPGQPCSARSFHSSHTPRVRTRGSALHRTAAWRRNPDRPGTHSPASALANSSCDASTPGAPPIPLLPNQSPSPQAATTTRISWIFLDFPRLPPSQLLAIPYSQHRTDC